MFKFIQRSDLGYYFRFKMSKQEKQEKQSKSKEQPKIDAPVKKGSYQECKGKRPLVVGKVKNATSRVDAAMLRPENGRYLFEELDATTFHQSYCNKTIVSPPTSQLPTVSLTPMVISTILQSNSTLDGSCSWSSRIEQLQTMFQLNDDQLPWLENLITTSSITTSSST